MEATTMFLKDHAKYFQGKEVFQVMNRILGRSYVDATLPAECEKAFRHDDFASAMDLEKAKEREDKDEISDVRAPSKGFTSFLSSSRVKKVGAVVIAGSSAYVVAPLIIPAAVTVIGFGKGGIVAGSSAAALMSSYGGTVAAGSLCATLQSIGAAGVATAGQTMLGAAAAGISGAIAYAF